MKMRSLFGFISGSSKKRAQENAKKESDKKKSEEVEKEDPICLNEIQHLVGHNDAVRSIVCVDIKGKEVQYLISSSDDTKIRIWDAHNGRLVHILDGHTMPIKCILVIDNRPSSSSSSLTATSADDENNNLRAIAHSLILISSSSDRSIRVWDILTGKCLQVLDKQNGSVFSLTAIPNEEEPQPMTPSEATPPQVLEPSEEKTVQLSPRVFKNVKRFCSGASDNNIQIWTITSDKGIVHSGEIKSYDGEKESKKIINFLLKYFFYFYNILFFI